MSSVAVCPTPPPLWFVIWVNSDRNKCSVLTLGNQKTCQTYSALPRTGTPCLAYSKYAVLLLHPVQKTCCFRSAGSSLIPLNIQNKGLCEQSLCNMFNFSCCVCEWEQTTRDQKGTVVLTQASRWRLNFFFGELSSACNMITIPHRTTHNASSTFNILNTLLLRAIQIWIQCNSFNESILIFAY